MAGVHYSNKLEDQAASAALSSHKEQRRPSVLDEDGKLSSASAATSLKYAQAKDLPSFPSAGLKLSSAGAAASIADSNKKNFEHWKPGSIPAANKAAMLAKDYEMDPLWQPEMSAAGSKAAQLAHRDTDSVNIWKSQGTAEGHSAAGQALKSKSPNAITERNVTADGRHKAMLAATGAMAGNRPRSDSTPANKGDTTNWALKAATTSHQGVPNSGPFTAGDPGFDAARVQNMAKNNVSRQMYGSTPPVALEVEEKNRQDTLRASAVAMARKMYAIQQTHIDEAAASARKGDSRIAANSSHQRNLSVSSDEQTADAGPQYNNLEEAARKLAQERLAKLHDEHAEYRQYYGAPAPSNRSRLSARLRRRASTGSREDSSDDEEQSRRIKKQMSLFQSKLADVDDKKRQADRDALLQAAHRNVEARMAKMDKDIFQETGKASPAQRETWEQQAREKAQKSSDERMKNVGKVHIGGGKYIDQAEIDAIARARLQPTFDEISDTAEKRRARDEEIRIENQRAQEQLAKDKAAADLEKLEAKRKKEEERQASKEQAAAEKEARRERERKEKEEKRKSVEVKPGRFNSILKRKGKEGTTEVEPASTPATVTTTEPVEVSADGSTVHDQVTRPATNAETARAVESDVAPAATAVAVSTSEETTASKTINTEHDAADTAAVTTDETSVAPTRRESKVKTWFKSHLKGSSKTAKDEKEERDEKDEKVEKDTKAVPVTGVDAGEARDESIRDVAMAGKETSDLYGTGSKEERPISPVRETERASASRTSSISSYSTEEIQVIDARPLSGNEHTAQVARSGLKPKLLKKVTPSKEEAGQPVRPPIATTTTDDDDDYQEAQDKFDDDRLVMPPSISNANVPLSSRASHEHSKFKEEL